MKSWTLTVCSYKTGRTKSLRFYEKKDFSIVKKMVCNFGTIPINKTKMQAANLILNGDNKVSQNKEYTVGH